MKKIFLLLQLLLLSIIINAQSLQNYVISSGGESISSTSLKVDYTIGESVIDFISSINVNLSQGFHQPSLTITSIENNELTDVACYPNPVSNNLTIEIPYSYPNAFEYTIYDITGKALITRTVYSGINTVDMSLFAIGNYILVLTDSGTNKVFKSKIVKIN